LDILYFYYDDFIETDSVVSFKNRFTQFFFYFFDLFVSSLHQVDAD